MQTFIIPIPKNNSSKHTASHVGADVEPTYILNSLNTILPVPKYDSTSRVQENLLCLSIITLVWRFGENKITVLLYANH